MVAIVRLSAAGSSSGRYCADSAWARITARECPTTSCTSRARRAWSSRSRAISWAWAASRWARAASASAATCETSEVRARAVARTASPATQGRDRTSMPTTTAPTTWVSLNVAAVSITVLSWEKSLNSPKDPDATAAKAIAAATGIETPLRTTVAGRPHRAQPKATRPTANSASRTGVPLARWSSPSSHTRASPTPGALRTSSTAVPRRVRTSSRAGRSPRSAPRSRTPTSTTTSASAPSGTQSRIPAGVSSGLTSAPAVGPATGRGDGAPVPRRDAC